jgi:hypothetical protein
VTLRRRHGRAAYIAARPVFLSVDGCSGGRCVATLISVVLAVWFLFGWYRGTARACVVEPLQALLSSNPDGRAAWEAADAGLTAV